MSTYLCGNMQVRVKASFGMAVLQPTYWHWLFVAIYGLLYYMRVLILCTVYFTTCVSS